ncbi:Ig-like domain-containing protein, partial [Algibacter pectinivorans]
MVNFTRYSTALKLNLFLLVIGCFLLNSLNTFGQTQPTFNLSQGPTLLANGAADEQIGAKYIYQDIEFSADGILIDAIVTIVDKVNVDEPNADSFTVDSTLGVDDRFEPTVNTGAGDGYVEWQIEFVLDGTVTDANDVGVRARLESFAVEAIDVDGFEYFEVIITDSYTIEGGNTPATELVVSQNGVWTRFQSDTDFAPGISPGDTQFAVRVNYTNISTINFRNGSSNNSNNRQNSMTFLGEVTFDVENTTNVNEPPFVMDNNGNVISSNNLFTGNVLTGSGDSDGNLDPTTVRLIDPNDPSNQGVVGSPLVVSGVGVYTVDNSGGIVFTPEKDYVGDASILFSVEDDLGVSSDQATLGITLVDPCLGGISGTLVWETAPTSNSEFDWTPDGALSNTFNDISGTGLNSTITFTGDTSTLSAWNFGTGNTPEVNVDNGIEALQFFTSGFDASGITITIAFSQPVNEVEFDLSHINGAGPNGDAYTISASEVGGSTLFPLFTESANPSYTTNNFGFIDSNDNSTFGDNDEVGVSFSSLNGINSITLVWDECTACNAGTVHGSAIQDISFCFSDDTPVAVADTVSVNEDELIAINILSNDDFGDNGPSSSAVTITSGPTNGIATVNDGTTPNDPTDDTIDYTPNANYSGSDQLTYEICDADGDCTTAVVTINVDPVTDAIVDANETVSTNEDTPVSGDLFS